MAITKATIKANPMSVWFWIAIYGTAALVILLAAFGDGYAASLKKAWLPYGQQGQ